MVIADLMALATGWRAKRTAVIVDPALQGIGGHHFSAAERLAAEMSIAGTDYSILCASKADPIVVDILKADRCFSETIYGRTDYGMQEFERRASAISKELSRMVRWTRPDLLVLPTCDQVLLYAIALTMRSIGGWQPTILAWFLYPPDDARSISEYRAADAALTTVLRSHEQMHACCETAAAKRLLESCLRFPLERRPGPSALPQAIINPREETGTGPRTPVIACVGHANIGKGYALLPEALAFAIEDNDRLAFKVHGFIDRRDTRQDYDIFQRLTALGSSVSVHNRVLTTREYHAFMGAADILLLPYVPDVYRSRGSGVFNEAEQLGKPVIAPRECTFAEEAFAEGRAVPIERLNPRAIADAVTSAVCRLPELERRAVSHARQLKTDGLQHLISRLLKADQRRPIVRQ